MAILCVCMYVCTDGRTNGWMDVCMYTFVIRINTYIYIHTYVYTHTRNYKQNVARRAYTNSFDAIDSPTKVESVEFDSYVGVEVAGERPPKTKVRTLNLGGAFKAFEKY